MGSDVGSQISRIESDGSVTTWVGGLPSSQTAGPEFVSGVADIAFIGDTMYFVLAGAGCTHGVPNTPNLVGRVDDVVNSDEQPHMDANRGSQRVRARASAAGGS